MRYSGLRYLPMTRRRLLALALLALRASAARSPSRVPAGPSLETSSSTPDAHQMADQQAAIRYARELIAAGDMDGAVASSSQSSSQPIQTAPRRRAFSGISTIVKGASTARKPSIRNCSPAIPRTSRRTTGSESSTQRRISVDASRSANSKTRYPGPIRSTTWFSSFA